jgi:hypothetical protein
MCSIAASQKIIHTESTEGPPNFLPPPKASYPVQLCQVINVLESDCQFVYQCASDSSDGYLSTSTFIPSLLIPGYLTAPSDLLCVLLSIHQHVLCFSDLPPHHLSALIVSLPLQKVCVFLAHLPIDVVEQVRLDISNTVNVAIASKAVACIIAICRTRELLRRGHLPLVVT